MPRHDLRWIACAARFTGLADFFVPLFQFVQLFIGKFLDINEIVIRWVMRTDEFVELQVKGFGVTILRVLDEEDDEKRNDGCACVNDELPGVRKMEERAACGP